MKRSPLIFWLTALAGVCPLAAQSGLSPFDETRYVGNVIGSVIDSKTGQGIRGASVLLIREPWAYRSGSSGRTEHLYNLLLDSSVRRGSTNSSGRFIVNSVPTPYPFRTYTVIALAPGYKVQVFDQIPIFPGAVMSLDCSFALMPGRGVGVVFRKTDPTAPYHYSHEKRLRIPAIPRDGQPALAGQRIFATREGLTGQTTANGHVIRKGDRFVSLPSRRALSAKGERGFQVRLSYSGRSVIAPVWDVGPWNIRDDHWSPSRQREQWRDLPQGLPQAQAAFERGYNGGKDGFGRRVSNPAGIDLADGIFWNDLRMRDNDWIGVEYLWLDQEMVAIPEQREPSGRSEPAGRPGTPRGESSRTMAILTEILAVLEGIRP